MNDKSKDQIEHIVESLKANDKRMQKAQRVLRKLLKESPTPAAIRVELARHGMANIDLTKFLAARTMGERLEVVLDSINPEN